MRKIVDNVDLPICALYLKRVIDDSTNKYILSRAQQQRYDELSEAIEKHVKGMKCNIRSFIIEIVSDASRRLAFDEWEYIVELLVYELEDIRLRKLLIA